MVALRDVDVRIEIRLRELQDHEDGFAVFNHTVEGKHIGVPE